jgi:hypothetical protein
MAQAATEPHPEYIISIICESTEVPDFDPVFFKKIVVDDSGCYGKSYACNRVEAANVYKKAEKWCKKKVAK